MIGEMKIDMWETSDLEPYARNARTHSAAQVDQIVASIREYGWTNPILIDESGGIIAGHGRVMAAQKMGMAEVPCIVLAGLNEAQRRAYVIADNKLALNAGWDDDMLRLELEELREMDFDLELTGFDLGELEMIFADEKQDDIGEARQTLSDRFGVPPFSVLNAREGWWQDRKRAWLALGIQSEVGRGGNMLGFSEVANRAMKGKAYD